MHKNYYMFERQVQYLNENFLNRNIIDCFSHRKDELCFELDSGHYLRIGLQIQFPYLLIYPVQNIKQPKVQFFKSLFGKIIHEFKIIEYDKIVKIIFDDFIIQIIFYGKNPNIFLITNSGEIADQFKKTGVSKDSKKHDIIFKPEDCDFKKLKILAREKRGLLLDDFISHHIGGFNRLIAREACFRNHVDYSQKTENLKENDCRALSNGFTKIVEEIRENKPVIYFENEQPVHLSLLNISFLQNISKTEEYDQINEAWKKYINYHQQKLKLERLLSRSMGVLKKRITFLEKTLLKITKNEEIEKRKKEAELKGNLLLTFKNEIEKGKREIELVNIFSKSQEKIRIKINPAKTVQENAQKYFNKFKNANDKKIEIGVKKDSYQKELATWVKWLQDAEKITTLTDAEKLFKLLGERNLIQQSGLPAKDEAVNDFSFNRLLLGKKWEVFIGKNDHNNDLLTFKFSHKFDIWLHAQGVPGSHVVIRLPSKDKLPEHSIIEQAASAAAYFSRAKNSAIVPVNYTRVKYVRRQRKSPPGTVIISNEKTIFVKPKKFI